MRAIELIENELLNEFIVKGEANTRFDKSFVFLYDQKYAVIVNANTYKDLSFGNGFSFVLTDAGKQEIYKALELIEFTDEYQSLAKALAPAGEYLKKVIINNVEIADKHKISSPGAAEFFMKVLKDQPAESLIKTLSSNLSYSYEIKNPEDIGNFLTMPKETSFAIHSPGDYVEIDHTTKIISRADHTSVYHDRMGGYKGNNHYILIGTDFSIERMDFLKIITQLKGSFPGYTIEGEEENTNIKGKIQQILSGRGEITVYHGTSNAIFGKIKKAGKMIPGLGPDYNDKIVGHSENLIYVSLQPDVARRYAVRASTSRINVILELTIRDLTKVEFDEDSLGIALSKLRQSNRRADKIIVKQIQTEFDIEDLLHMHWKIKELFGEYDKLSKKQKGIINYIKYLALRTMSDLSFAYKGTIPLKDISVYETGKSKKYDDATYDADYEEVAGNIKRGE